MNHFVANSDKQLGLCLRMLHAMDVAGPYTIITKSKQVGLVPDIIYEITADMDEPTYKKLQHLFDTMCS